MDERTGLPVVGMVGAGQLARMTHQAAVPLGQSLRVLADSADDGAALVAHDVVVGDYRCLDDLRAFAVGCDAVTFDHEHVPNAHIAALEADGVTVHPTAAALVFAHNHPSGAAEPSRADEHLTSTLKAALQLVDVREYLRAEPDPLRVQAPALLEHLRQGHGAQLAACLRARGHLTASWVEPQALDRTGLVLTVLGADGVETVRLDFPEPVTSVEQLAPGLRAVLSCSGRCWCCDGDVRRQP